MGRRGFTGRHFILAFDIVRVNISRFTQTLCPTPSGIVFVFTHDLRLVGLPADERFVDKSIADAILFQPLDAIELPLLKAGLSAWEEQGRARRHIRTQTDADEGRAGGSSQSRIHQITDQLAELRGVFDFAPLTDHRQVVEQPAIVRQTLILLIRGINVLDLLKDRVFDV